MNIKQIGLALTILMLFLSVVNATTDYIGVPQSGNNNFGSTHLFYQNITASGSGTLQTIGINVSSNGGLALSDVGIYSDSGDSPNLPLCTSGTVLEITGWNIFNVAGCATPIVMGTKYWLAFHDMGINYVVGVSRGEDYYNPGCTSGCWPSPAVANQQSHQALASMNMSYAIPPTTTTTSTTTSTTSTSTLTTTTSTSTSTSTISTTIPAGVICGENVTGNDTECIRFVNTLNVSAKVNNTGSINVNNTGLLNVNSNIQYRFIIPLVIGILFFIGYLIDKDIAMKWLWLLFSFVWLCDSFLLNNADAVATGWIFALNATIFGIIVIVRLTLADKLIRWLR